VEVTLRRSLGSGLQGREVSEQVREPLFAPTILMVR